MIALRAERPSDYSAIHEVNLLAFESDAEPKLVVQSSPLWPQKMIRLLATSFSV